MQYCLHMSTDQHRQLKTLAAYSGLSIKEFILSRIFVEASEIIFSPRVRKTMRKEELKTAQDILFKKAQIITVAPEKWESLKRQTCKQD